MPGISNTRKEKVFTKYHGKCVDCGYIGKGAGWHKILDAVPWREPISDPRKYHYKKRMFYCGKLEIHHVIPRFAGGKDNVENLILLCPACHIIRHNGTPKKTLQYSNITND